MVTFGEKRASDDNICHRTCTTHSTGLPDGITMLPEEGERKVELGTMGWCQGDIETGTALYHALFLSGLPGY